MLSEDARFVYGSEVATRARFVEYTFTVLFFAYLTVFVAALIQVLRSVLHGSIDGCTDRVGAGIHAHVRE